MRKLRCPHCGNTDSLSISDNGLPLNHPDVTLLCTKVCQEGEQSFDEPYMADDGIYVCGMQWQPNQGEGLIVNQPQVVETSKTEVFKQPLCHVIDIDKHVVIGAHEHNLNRWYDAHEIAFLYGRRYQIIKSKLGVQHYYVFVREFNEGVLR